MDRGTPSDADCRSSSTHRRPGVVAVAGLTTLIDLAEGLEEMCHL